MHGLNMQGAPFGRKPPQILVVVLLITALAHSGCSVQTSLQGEVRFDGEPVATGALTVTPVDGKGAISGTSIQDGTYRIDDLPPGKKIVQVIGTKKVPFVASSAEMEAMSQHVKPTGGNADLVFPADTIPEDAPGNRAEIEVRPGKNQQNFDLHSPAK